MGPHVRALALVVRPGSVVVDVGAGSGILALIACRLGARRVFAIDTNEAIEVGRELARENGVADRIVFFQKDVREVELPERADVIVSDLRGTLPLCGDHLAVIADVRSRFLKPGGVLLPARDRLMVGVVERADLYEWAVGPATGPLGLTLGSMRNKLCNTTVVDRQTEPLRSENVLSTSESWATLEYSTVQSTPIVGSAELRVKRGGTGHGLAVWFDTVLTGEHGFNTAPGHELCYGRLFLPWPRPVVLSQEDTVRVEVWAQPNGDPWGWNSVVTRAAGGREAFKQSSFMAFAGKPTARSIAGRRQTLSPTRQS